MKTLYMLLFSGLLLFTSCEKLLDKTPTDFIQPENYYQSENDLNLALAGVYDPLGSEYLYASSLWFQFGLSNDESFYPNSPNSFSAPMFYQHDATNPYVSGLWEQCYVGIERANLLIENINRPVMDDDKRKVIHGEALFMRAFYHFLLVSNYGDVPLKISSTDDINNVRIPRTPSKDVYTQIIRDMTDAESKVMKASAIGNSSRISQTTVWGMLARVCLYMAGNPVNDGSKYLEALNWADKVIKSNEHALNTTYDNKITNSAYSQIFINQAQDVYDVKESMWEADFHMNGGNTSYNEGGRLGTYQIDCRNLDTGFASGNIRTTIRLYNRYQAGDFRRDWAIAPFSFTSTATSAIRVPYPASSIINRQSGKWRRFFEPISFAKEQYRTGQNFPILRYADVLLMFAEAEFEVHGATPLAYNAINQVRRRAYNLPLDVPSVEADLNPALSETDFENALRDERSRELCFEALRRPDLIRWGIFNEVMTAMTTEILASNATSTNRNRWIIGYNTAASSPKYLLLPIPASELNVNKAMTQNPGW
ncbi:RagB/SusD family nutrient uptake outer membrane protein [Desertivirga xinjiangensis]|uniref:RagB/SusD family nutrient uptake outer membrane protein n=1 Tax=Desertivirga xinjiangensis TaxID=539206 RepID=UPI00210DA16E|nr:RagB/SusD family nutrient uptake outer membrane protein [Pedobacter xinjiangensis]